MRIQLRHTKMALVSLFETSLGVELFEERIIVRVDRDGVTGWGEWVVEPTPLYSYETLQTAWHVLRDCLIPALLEKNFERRRCVGKDRLGSRLNALVLFNPVIDNGSVE